MLLIFNIPESGQGSITGSREDLLVLIEAARRDLNACAQAMGASNEWKTRYGKLGDELGANCRRYDVPRVDLMAREPFAMGIGPTVLVDPIEDRAALYAAGERFMADNVRAHPDDPNPIHPQVDASEGWTGRKCQTCRGTGERDTDPIGPCRSCGGTGEEWGVIEEPAVPPVDEEVDLDLEGLLG